MFLCVLLACDFPLRTREDGWTRNDRRLRNGQQGNFRNSVSLPCLFLPKQKRRFRWKKERTKLSLRSDWAATMENNDSIISREKIDQAAVWLGSAVSSAFFSSLERFSCVNVATSDPDNDEDDDDYYSTTTATPTAASTTTTSPPSIQIDGKKTNDVSNLPV
ncbi:hypothetical protein JHK86_013680 [Glycine max]|nr:hypothetical protein JHK86_013680 [Glycine max]